MRVFSPIVTGLLGFLALPRAFASDEAPTYTTVVTGSRTEVRADEAVVPTEVITRRQIEATGARDLSELLLNHPGVEVVWSFRGAGVRIQGLDPEYVLVLLDGDRLSGRVGGWIDLSRYTLRDIERIEIVKGPASAIYGADAMGGVINLITRKSGRPFEANAQGSYGSRGEIDFRGAAGGVRDGLDLRLGGGYRGAEPFDLNPQDVATTGSGFTRFDVDGSAVVPVSDRVQLKSYVSYLRRDERAIDLGVSGAVFDRRQRVEQFDGTVRSRVDFGKERALALRAHHSLFRDQLLNDQRGAVYLDNYAESIERLYEFGAQWEQRFDAAGKHLLVAGAEVLLESLKSPRLLEGQGRRQRYSVIVQDEWRLFEKPRLYLSPGLRWDVDTQFGSRPSPRLALRYDPAPYLTMRASYGWGYRSPNFQELFLNFENPSVGYVVQGNPRLKPELSQGLNVSADFRILDRATISASVFRTDIQDLVSIVNLPLVDTDQTTRYGYGNVARAFTQGAEAQLRVKLVSGVYFDAGLLLNDTRDLSQDRVLEGRPAQRATFQLSGRHRGTGLEATLRGAWVSRRPFYVDTDLDGDTDTYWSPAYADLNILLGWKVWGKMRVFAVGNNLFNAADALYLARPPRSYFAGVSGEF